MISTLSFCTVSMAGVVVVLVVGVVNDDTRERLNVRESFAVCLRFYILTGYNAVWRIVSLEHDRQEMQRSHGVSRHS